MDAQHYFTVVIDSLMSLSLPILGSTLVIAGVIFFTSRTAPSAAKSSLKTFLAWLFPSEIINHPSSKLDVRFLIVNTPLFCIFLSVWAAGAVVVAANFTHFLLYVFGSSQEIPNGYFWPSVLLTLTLFIAVDFSFFLSHYLQHKVAWLWRFHRVHHSAEVLNPLTAFRQHPLDQFFEGLIVGIFSGLVYGLFDFYYLGLAETYVIMGMNALTYIFYLCGAHLRHSHIRLSYPGWLSKVLISPFQHQVHHSYRPEHIDKNFGGVLAVWDWCAKTLYLPAKDEVLRFGMASLHNKPMRSLRDLYLSPFSGFSNYLSFVRYYFSVNTIYSLRRHKNEKN